MNMKITDFYYILSLENKKELLELLKSDEELMIVDDILIIDWLQAFHLDGNMSVRLYNSLYSESRSYRGDLHNKYLNEVTRWDITGLRNIGETSWKEFEKLRAEYNEKIKK